jgi:N-acetylglucosamine-6-phosphate deacetylase
MKLFGRRYDTKQAVGVEIADGRIFRLFPAAADPEQTAAWPWLAPGLWDLQVNGYGGQEFSAADLTTEKVLRIAETLTGFGVARFCPTLTTQSLAVLRHGMQTIAAACESSPQAARRIAGIHLEGPYIAREDGPRGAHPLAHCREPDWDEFQRLQEASGGRIRILTMSVEFDQSPDFIRKATAAGVVVAIGHTSADSAHIHRAVDAGARLSTHLGNGSHRLLPRHPNYLWDQLAEDRLSASLIADGHHLPPEVLQCFLRAKTPDRCILVSDLSGMAGLPPGRYQAQAGEIEILEDGRLVVAGQRQILAGASRPIGVGLANVLRFAGIDLATAVAMAVDHPARLLGLTPGWLQAGQPADLVLFHIAPPTESQPSRFELCATVLDGRVAWESGGGGRMGDEGSLVTTL